MHESLAAFEQGLDRNDPEISPSMLYAWAALQEGCAYANGAPNLSLDTPALCQLADKFRLPIAGKDFKTGQTLIKTVLAPMLKIRMLGLAGWFSTNILGNRDGEVLLDPDSFRTKEESKLDVLSSILNPNVSPELYNDIFHLVNINYYRPRGDAKEGWENIDLYGWLDYPMQLKVNFLARDSILAAPLVLDLVLFLDLAARAGLSGPQDWLSFYFKTPQSSQPQAPPDDDVFRQHAVLQDKLQWFGGLKKFLRGELDRNHRTLIGRRLLVGFNRLLWRFRSCQLVIPGPGYGNSNDEPGQAVIEAGKARQHGHSTRAQQSAADGCHRGTLWRYGFRHTTAAQPGEVKRQQDSVGQSSDQPRRASQPCDRQNDGDQIHYRHDHVADGYFARCILRAMQLRGIVQHTADVPQPVGRGALGRDGQKHDRHDRQRMRHAVAGRRREKTIDQRAQGCGQTQYDDPLGSLHQADLHVEAQSLAASANIGHQKRTRQEHQQRQQYPLVAIKPGQANDHGGFGVTIEDRIERRASRTVVWPPVRSHAAIESNREIPATRYKQPPRTKSSTATEIPAPIANSTETLVMASGGTPAASNNVTTGRMIQAKQFPDPERFNSTLAPRLGRFRDRGTRHALRTAGNMPRTRRQSRRQPARPAGDSRIAAARPWLLLQNACEGNFAVATK